MRFKTISGNEPLNRPGVYLLTNLTNGKNYVGISIDLRRRVLSHLHARPSVPVLCKALRKYGPESFLVTPLYYSTSGTDHLPGLEAEFIKEYRSTEHGYNVQQASGAVGPYGPEFGAAVSRGWASATPERRANISAMLRDRMSTPEARASQSIRSKAFHADSERSAQRLAKQLATMATAEYKAKCSVRIKAMQTSEFIAARTAKMIATKNTPEFRARFSETAKVAQSDPERKAQRLTKMRATMATAEFKARRSAASLAMQSPELKRKKSEALKSAYAADSTLGEKIAASKRGRIWITDGVNNRCIRVTTETLPQGWRRGKSPYSPPR
jgi:group I intron endonuclease